MKRILFQLILLTIIFQSCKTGRLESNEKSTNKYSKIYLLQIPIKKEKDTLVLGKPVVHLADSPYPDRFNKKNKGWQVICISKGEMVLKKTIENPFIQGLETFNEDGEAIYVEVFSEELFFRIPYGLKIDQLLFKNEKGVVFQHLNVKLK